jgi:prepilin-type N-terminal cleavage/methylation domain-containing protein
VGDRGNSVRTSKTQEAGFTIIEVLIVLAIGGIIMMIVFMSIPVLQRSARNNQRKNDVGDILAVISHYELSNSGGFPTSLTLPSVQSQLKLNYYDTATISLASPGAPGIYLNFYGGYTAASAAPVPTTTDKDTVIVTNYRLCDDNNPGSTLMTGAGFNDVVAIFALETGNTTKTSCQSI